MFVRWKKRWKKRAHYDAEAKGTYGYQGEWVGGWIKYAVLCKSVRVNGKPTQKFIVHLGDITEMHLNRELNQFNFWKQARWILNNIHRHPDGYGLTPEETTIEAMQKIVQEIEKIVPALSQNQMHEHHMRLWGDCRAARDEVETRFFLEPYSLEPGGYDGWRKDADQTTAALMAEIEKNKRIYRSV